MNREQYLLTKLAEECSEVTKVALKAQQFGLDGTKEDGGLTNREKLNAELQDLFSIVEMLCREIKIGFEVDENALHKKMEKVNFYYQVSVDAGKVTNDSTV